MNANDQRDLEFVAAQLRHVYMLLKSDAVINVYAFADGLIAPQIRKLEEVLQRQVERGEVVKACPHCLESASNIRRNRRGAQGEYCDSCDTDLTDAEFVYYLRVKGPKE